MHLQMCGVCVLPGNSKDTHRQRLRPCEAMLCVCARPQQQQQGEPHNCHTVSLTLQGAAGALHAHCPALHLHRDILGDGQDAVDL